MLKYYRGSRLIRKNFKTYEAAFRYVEEHFITEFKLDDVLYLEVCHED